MIRTLEEKRQQMENQLQLAQRERQKAQEDKEKAEKAYASIEEAVSYTHLRGADEKKLPGGAEEGGPRLALFGGYHPDQR